MTDSMDASLSKLQEKVKSQRAVGVSNVGLKESDRTD